MATAGDGWPLYESGGDGEKSYKRLSQPEINEEPQRFSHKAGQNHSTGVSDEGGKSTSISSTTKGKSSELEQMWKLKNFTRSEVKHPTTIENLPGELLLNVFIRLLAKQLAQMRSVSKAWNTLLSHPSFVKSHLHHSINNNDRVLLVFYDDGPEPYTAHPSRFPHPQLTNFIKLPPVNPKFRQSHTSSEIEVIGSIHGLICSSYNDDDVFHIWNPSLSAVSTVPPHSIPSRDRYVSSFRFGFDLKTDDYKIVKLIGLTCTSPLVVEEWLQVEVYSMRKGSWKFITQRFPSHVTRISHHDRVCLCVDGHDGHLHWFGYIGEEKKLEMIVAFDLGSETFHEIPLPNSILGSTQTNVIGVWDGKLCVFPAVVTDDVCDVWVMDEYGVPESWVKHVFSKFVGHEVLLGLTSTNEFLLLDAFSRLVLYNPTEHKAKTLENFCHDVYSLYKVVEYVDSLVWVAPTEREMVDDAGQS